MNYKVVASVFVWGAAVFLLASAYGLPGIGMAGEVARTEQSKPMGDATIILFLHHSTGSVIWQGGVAQWFEKYNADNKAVHMIRETAFPKKEPYGWANYPYDYWNIWVKHGGQKPFKGEPNLEILAMEHNVIVFKHCFPVCDLKADTGDANIESAEKRVENYKLQYNALKKKMRQFPQTRFIVWTGAAQVKNQTTEENAKRAKAFFDWVKAKWDQKGDNIYLWDFYALETEGGLYLKDKYAADPDDSHPNQAFAKKVAPLLCQRIIDVINGKGDAASLTGRKSG